MTIDSTMGVWGVSEVNAFDQCVTNFGVFHGAIQDIALALAGKIADRNRLQFKKFTPKQVSARDITGLSVEIFVDGCCNHTINRLICAEISERSLDMECAISKATGVVLISAGKTAESRDKLEQLAIANKALASLTQEQRDAIMAATRMLCPVGGA